ncbi:MAG: xanthan lyase [Bacteroidales bacterium]|nr:xanthan lyase [Bacteroidales bacterium]
MRFAATIFAILTSVICVGQTRIVDDFAPVCDSLSIRVSEMTGVEGELKLKTIMKRKTSLDFYFNESLGDFPWNRQNVKRFRSALHSLFPERYRNYKVGEIYSRNVDLDKLAMPPLTNDGNPPTNRHRVNNQNGKNTLVTRLDIASPSKGLTGRHIALWQSHGRYYDQGEDRWKWQRPCLFQTCEDMFTQGFVLPYLVPMLENAGAYILMPRERDTQRHEIIVDNDPSCGARGCGKYEENGKWQEAGYGFADTAATYHDLVNPFAAGSARQALCVGPRSKANCSASWTPDIPERGEYAVYVSYKTVTNSTASAHYTVRHLGGQSEFLVNQKMGGGTWIYLGTFEFGKGTEGGVYLDNRLIEGHSYEVGSVVTADAVRFGGGMGNIARTIAVSEEDSLSVEVPEPVVSGLPRYAEGARYYLQWAGADTCVYYQNKGADDYRDDFMSRGDWVEWISRGSRTNPKKEGGLGIPVDLSFGFHSDAGVTPNDSLVGTLAIYTYKSEGKVKLPSGEDRLTSRMYADLVQSQIVNDLRECFDSTWTRRSIWDRAYRESRTPSCPAMLLELLSHQNFADMRYGHDPSFKFTVSRAVYKGMLKYLSYRYGCEYVVQPLPVDHFGVTFGVNGKAVVSWKAVEDPLEPTAVPTGYIIYRRIGNGVFDQGTAVQADADENGYICAEVNLPVGEVVSFKVVAYNEGGRSFPSETVSIGLPAKADSLGRKVLIVNNFDRVSGPSSFDGECRAGFDGHDRGVAYIRDITHVGEMYNFRRADQWKSNDDPGFGASYSDMAGEIIAGNTFDYASVHGESILRAGHAFYSCSNERFAADSLIYEPAWCLDLICGKQKTTLSGGKTGFEVFPAPMQKALSRSAGQGINMIISGANIASDMTGGDETFLARTFGYKMASANATRGGLVKPHAYKSVLTPCQVRIITKPNSLRYCVEAADGLAPACKTAKSIYRYSDSGISAAVAYHADGYTCMSFGFPIEAVESQETIDNLIINSLEYLKK